MRLTLVAVLCVCLASCDKPVSNQAETQTKDTSTGTQATQLVQDVSGVWTGSDGGLVTIDYRDNQLRLVLGDDPKFVKLGEVDVDQETVNLLLKRSSDDKDIIWTIHRVWDSNKTSFNLELIMDDGSRDELSFVRKVTADDINRLANLYSRPAAQASVSSSADSVAPLQQAPSAPSVSPPQSGDSSSSTAAVPTEASPQAAQLDVVRRFYGALSQGDGQAASALVIPEKRDTGSFSAPELSQYYSSFRQPLRLDDEQISPGLGVAVHYSYVKSDGSTCNAAAVVAIDNRDGPEAPMIAGIKVVSGNC